MLDLTIAIPVRNEAQNIRTCLEAIGTGFASRVVVIDSGSTDATSAMATAWGAEVIHFEWNGAFPKKRNWFLRNHTPTTQWVLFLDADEFLTDEFKRELSLTLPQSDFSGYWLRYSIYFLCKELKFGYPLDKLALFRVGYAEYERIDEEQWSRLDMEIHEHPNVHGKVGQILGKIDHRDNRSIAHYIDKHNDYSSWEAHRFVANARSLNRKDFTLRQRLKYAIVKSPFAGPIYFFGAYFFLGGFLDGTRGLAFAFLKSAYFTQVYCKIREIEHLQSPD